MNKFEAVILCSPDISTTALNSEISDFKKIISDKSGKIINTEDWGLRELNFNIGNFKKAFYNFFQIEIDGNSISEIKKVLNQNDKIIRHLFVKVSDHQELPTKLNYEKK